MAQTSISFTNFKDTMFTGFPAAARNFLFELRANNNREWFAENKSRYERTVLQPAIEFVTAVEKPLQKISPHFQAIPKRSGGSIMRIYRDIRFSKNKLPFKTNLGIHFRHEMGASAHAPGFYFHIDPENVFMGGGVWQPEKGVLDQIRLHIIEESDGWKKILSRPKLKRDFFIDGSSLKRPPQGYDPKHPLIEDLKRKDHFVTRDLTWEAISEKTFINLFAENLKTIMPYMRFLCDALRLPS